MRSFLSFVLLLAVSVPASADQLIVVVTDKDASGKKMEKNIRKLTVHMVYSADREKRLIQFLKGQFILQKEPWIQWAKEKRKDGDVVVYNLTTDISTGYTMFRLVTDTATEKTFIVEGHASLNGMQALSGDNFQLYSLGHPIMYGRKKY